MSETKNDLSYNSTKLDYMSLHRTAIIAFAHARNKLEVYLSRTHDLDLSTATYACRNIKTEADQLAIVGETLHTLEEGLSRQDLEIVNKPGVPDK